VKEKTDQCSQCKFPFFETSVQLHRRLKNETGKLCRSCERINNAEANAAKRTRRKNRTVEENLFNQLACYRRNMGKLSVSFIMRKLGVTYHEAESLAEKVNA
jgi:hypothetical protein